MTYRPRKEYFADYMWQQTGTWGYYNGAAYVAAGLPFGTVVGHKYDLRQIWRDVCWAGGVAVTPWFDAPLLSSTKFYALYNHEYTTSPTVGGAKLKNGLFCISGYQPNVPVSIADTSGTMQQAGGAGAAGFSGQYGKAFAINYTGTMHEAAFAFSTGYATVDQAGNYTFLEPEDPLVVPPYNPAVPGSQFAPLAISLYGSRDSPLTTLNGIHAIIIPPGTTQYLYTAAGVLTPYAGGATGRIVIAVGDLSQPYLAGFLTYVTSYAGYDDGTALDIVRNKEFFIRLMYYPESKPIKRIGVSNPNDPNLDRRLLIYFGSDKKRLKFVGKVALIDYDYTTPKNYMFVACFNDGWNGQAGTPYFPTLAQFDEVVCASEWLPYDQGEAFVSHTQFPTFAKLRYVKDSSENNYDATSTTENVVLWQQKEIVEIWSLCQNWGIRNKLLSGYDFAVAFPDIWTVATATGTGWRQNTTPWALPVAPFEDTFDETYTNKNNDRDWAVLAGTWNTSAYPGYLYSSGVGSITQATTNLQRDYVITTKFTFTGDAANTLVQYFGVTAAGGVANTTIRVAMRASDNMVFVRERTGGAWVDRGNTVAHDPEGEHTWTYVRLGAYFKIYMDGVMILAVPLASAVHTQSCYEIELFGAVIIKDDYLNINYALPNSYGYMYNTGITTASDGSIHYHQAVNGIMGYADLTAWEAFSESTGTTGELWLRLHYDNGVAGTNYMGVKVAWDGAAKTLTLYQSSAVSYSVAIPSDLEVVNGYTQHSYKLYWAASGGFITQIALYNASDNSLLKLVDGISLAYGANMEVEYLQTTQNGTESPYLGQVVMWEQPEPSNDFIETPVFTGTARLIAPIDDKGSYEVLFKAMDYNLNLMSEYNSATSEHRSEHETTFTDLLETVILENGLTYWRWFHYWNYKVTDVPVGWIPSRMRGLNMHQVYERMAGWAGMRFASTPEQQFLFCKYYRNFDIDGGASDADPLEINNTDPQGIYWSSSTVLNYNLSQLGWLTGFSRADDSQIGRRVGSVVTQAADFTNPLADTAALHQDTYDTVSAAHVAPTMTARPAVSTTGNVTINDGGNAPDMLNPTVGSVNTQTNAQTNTWLAQEAASFLSTYSHKNEMFIATCYSSYQWYRPMDTIHVEVDVLDPSIQALNLATILRMYRYVVHSAHHIMHTNEVQYVIGRREDYMDGQTEENTVDGYGDVHNKVDKLMRLNQTATDANSNTCQ